MFRIILFITLCMPLVGTLVAQDFETASKRARKWAKKDSNESTIYRHKAPSVEQAIVSLGILGGDENARFLAELLSEYSGNSYMRGHIVNAIRLTGSKAANATLLRVVASDPEDNVRASAFEALGQSRDQAVVGQLEAMLPNLKPNSVFSACASALEKLTGKRYPTSPMPASFENFEAYLIYTRISSERILEGAEQERDLLKASKLSPKTPEIWGLLGWLVHWSDFERGKKYLERAVELELPTNKYRHELLLGRIHESHRQYPQALKIYRRAYAACQTDRCRIETGMAIARIQSLVPHSNPEKRSHAPRRDIKSRLTSFH